MTDGYGDGKGFHLEYRQLPCKSALPSSPAGDSGTVGNNGGGTAAASSDRKAHWVKGFREKAELVTASIFVENRRNTSSKS
ncbi:hypothetical protein HPB48_022509 [Haemaphysalis longicornis]|uniref:Uncharacterized protein n=1 Tax=Haemaphysalis longicornis TaxID=44386 RepID=A0A9J6F6Q2_HAELO|nr:hypothetical protein HPB48_022509 [Haemaphysalis longicornis]